MAKPRKTPKPDVIRANQQLMDYLSRLYSPGQLQLCLEEHLAGLPPSMPPPERQMRIDAIRALGYKPHKGLHFDKENQS